jgi:hypothetical protein
MLAHNGADSKGKKNMPINTGISAIRSKLRTLGKFIINSTLNK